jgi:hypothetical protein
MHLHCTLSHLQTHRGWYVEAVITAHRPHDEDALRDIEPREIVEKVIVTQCFRDFHRLQDPFEMVQEAARPPVEIPWSPFHDTPGATGRCRWRRR